MMTAAAAAAAASDTNVSTLDVLDMKTTPIG
ncbi:MAG: hypothetical protein ACI8RD_011036 [Bacillariaceae sp.]|jgi:hypothetical protein